MWRRKILYNVWVNQSRTLLTNLRNQVMGHKLEILLRVFVMRLYEGKLTLGQLHEFPIAAIRNYHKLSGPK